VQSEAAGDRHAGALVSVAGIVVALGTAVALGTGRVAYRAQ
jgi:hypothetical protein